MREILFRGKRLDNGEWVEGFLFELSCDGQSVPCIGIEPLSANDYGEIYKSDYCEVYSDTVCQFTGLLDKNGKKIFEGDICNWNSTAYSNAVPYVVEFSESDCRYVLSGTTDKIPIWSELSVEVISTIYDKED